MKVDYLIIGAGIIGAALAAEIARRKPAARILVAEKEKDAAWHQTGRNSGVVHSGVYYTPGSLKTRCCRAGMEATKAFCATRGIGYEERGKLLVATNAQEAANLAKLQERAAQNDVKAERLELAELKRLEPAITGLAALHIPATAITDYAGITRALLADVETAGGTVRFGLPITQNITTQLAYNISQEKYEFDDSCLTAGVYDFTKCNISAPIRNAITDNPNWVKSSVSGNVVYNTIDDVKNPHYGIYANAGIEVAGLGGDAKFVKYTARASVYQTLWEEADIVGVLSGGAGYMQSYGSNGLRLFDLFQSNDRMIRGFDYNGIGPAASNGAGGYDHLGGTTYFNASAEAQFPLPLVPESLGLRGAVFADAATLYGNPISGVDPSTVGSQLRASVGVGLMWASPFGPLRIDYAKPIKKQPTDDVQEFNFGISTRF